MGFVKTDQDTPKPEDKQPNRIGQGVTTSIHEDGMLSAFNFASDSNARSDGREIDRSGNKDKSTKR